MEIIISICLILLTVLIIFGRGAAKKVVGCGGMVIALGIVALLLFLLFQAM